ncbi:MAG: hypothetical protein ACRDRL_13305 [Sciscionella sp.]
MKRLFWLGIGAAAGVAVSRKINATARRATPAGIAENLGEAVHEMAQALGSFGADVRAGMNEREGQLTEMVADRSGITPRASGTATSPQVASASNAADPAGRRGSRAPRAGGSSRA